MKNLIEKNKKGLPEINTTALPDIIFMLLFFFMVVTVIKKNDDSNFIDIPAVTFGEKETDNENALTLSIQYISEDQIHYGFNNVMVENFESMKNFLDLEKISSDNWHDKIIKIRIDEKVNMKEVNALKSLLQDNKMYDIEYVVNET